MHKVRWENVFVKMKEDFWGYIPLELKITTVFLR